MCSSNVNSDVHIVHEQQNKSSHINDFPSISNTTIPLYIIRNNAQVKRSIQVLFIPENSGAEGPKSTISLSSKQLVEDEMVKEQKELAAYPEGQSCSLTMTNRRISTVRMLKCTTIQRQSVAYFTTDRDQVKTQSIVRVSYTTHTYHTVGELAKRHTWLKPRRSVTIITQ